jgi:RNA polymerase sigma-70 factor, ECF subfamily
MPAFEARKEAEDAARLLQAAKSGDQSARERLFARHRPLIQAYLGRRVRSSEDGEDLVQNVFLRATRSLESFRSDCPFSQWLLRIAANELKNYYERQLSRRPASLEEISEDFSWEPQHSDGGPGPYVEAEERDVAARLLAAAKTVCSESEAMVLTMFYQNESLEEIGRLLDMKSATVRSHFLRARSKLLGFLMAKEPDLVGGMEAIRQAEACALAAEELGQSERDAFARRDGRSESYRNACLKVARHLPLPTVLLAGEWIWTRI